MRHLTLLGLTVALTISASARPKPALNWQTGRVADARNLQGPTVATTNRDAQSSGYSGPITHGDNLQSSTTTVTRTYGIPETVILGADYLYTVQNSGEPSRGQAAMGALFGARAMSGPRRSCRFVIGDDVRFAQQGGILKVIDADGRPCEAQIVRQERIAARP